MEGDNATSSSSLGGSSTTEFSSFREGKAEILCPCSKNQVKEVFYNPVQEFNRDFSSAALKVYVDNLEQWKKGRCPLDSKDHGGTNKKGVTNENGHELEKADARDTKTQVEVSLFEGLSATGLRSARYALEVPGIQHIVANDISKDAYHLIQKNIEHNKVGHIVTPSNQDASLVMYQHRYPQSKRFTIVDIDPYGSAAPFLDGAVQAVTDGGLLMVTCTDMGVLCGNHSDACYGKYGSMSLKAKFCHEMALRILLSSLESHANRYKRYVVPLLSISVDFYVRIFVQVFTSPSEVKRSPSKQSLVYHCVGCGSYHFQLVGRRIEEGSSKKYPPAIGPAVGMNCDQCGSKFHVGGPIWTEPMHDVNFVKALKQMVKFNQDNYKTSQRIIGMLSMVEEELPEVPLYYALNHLSNILHCNTPSIIQFRSALLGLGYQVSGAHACGTAIKTNAPNSVVWDIMRCWVKLYPVKRKAKDSPGTVILDKEPEVEASFEAQSGANPSSRKQRLLRFQPNPETNWGPKARAKKGDNQEPMTDKRERLQGKRKKPNMNETSFKKYACKRFKAGKCDLGENCRYSHVEEDGLKTESTGSENTTQMDTQIEIEQSVDNGHVEKSKTTEDNMEGDDVKPADIDKQRRSLLLEADQTLLF